MCLASRCPRAWRPHWASQLRRASPGGCCEKPTPRSPIGPPRRPSLTPPCSCSASKHFAITTSWSPSSCCCTPCFRKATTNGDSKIGPQARATHRGSPAAMRKFPRISVAIPIYNEQAGLPELHRRVMAVLDTLPGGPHEVVYVDDGSRDGSRPWLESLAQSDGSVKV